MAPDGSIYAQAGNGVLYALDQATGSVQWTYGTPSASSFVVGPVVSSDGTVFLFSQTNSNSELCALDGKTGYLKWHSAQLENYIVPYATPALSDQGLLFTQQAVALYSDTVSLVALSAASGTIDQVYK